ncbi:MAG: hypothetical protein V8R52_06695 [Coprobacter fastidiosus]
MESYLWLPKNNDDYMHLLPDHNQIRAVVVVTVVVVVVVVATGC